MAGFLALMKCLHRGARLLGWRQSLSKVSPRHAEALVWVLITASAWATEAPAPCAQRDGRLNVGRQRWLCPEMSLGRKTRPVPVPPVRHARRCDKWINDPEEADVAG